MPRVRVLHFVRHSCYALVCLGGAPSLPQELRDDGASLLLVHAVDQAAGRGALLLLGGGLHRPLLLGPLQGDVVLFDVGVVGVLKLSAGIN